MKRAARPFETMYFHQCAHMRTPETPRILLAGTADVKRDDNTLRVKGATQGGGAL